MYVFHLLQAIYLKSLSFDVSTLKMNNSLKRAQGFRWSFLNRNIFSRNKWKLPSSFHKWFGHYEWKLKGEETTPSGKFCFFEFYLIKVSLFISWIIFFNLDGLCRNFSTGFLFISEIFFFRSMFFPEIINLPLGSKQKSSWNLHVKDYVTCGVQSNKVSNKYQLNLIYLTKYFFIAFFLPLRDELPILDELIFPIVHEGVFSSFFLPFIRLIKNKSKLKRILKSSRRKFWWIFL